MTDVGSVIQGKRAQYRLKAILGEGLTARVFLADVVPADSIMGSEVAVKALRPGLDSEIKERFRDEYSNLTAILGAFDRLRSEAANADPRLAPARPPRFWEHLEEGDKAYLIMEVMRGRRLEALLATEGPLPEPIALRLGAQLFGLFQFLHRQLERTYSDFKFENLWWEPLAERLFVTDWNVLSKVGDISGLSKDLERGARALFRILTGNPLSHVLRLDQQPGWPSLTKGVQNLLLQMLDGRLEARPQTAEEIVREIARLLSYWERDPRRLLAQVVSLLNGFEAGDKRPGAAAPAKSAHQAVAILSVLKRRKDQGDEGKSLRWAAELENELLVQMDRAAALLPTVQRILKSAEDLLHAGSDQPALDLLEEAAQEYPDNLLLQRRLALARAFAGGAIPATGERRALWGAMNSLDEDNLREGLRKLDALGSRPRDPQKTVSFDGVNALRDEITFRLDLLEATRLQQDPQGALMHGEKALEVLRSLSERCPDYGAALRAAIGVDVESGVDALRKNAERAQMEQQTRGQAKKLIEYAENKQWRDGAALFQQEPAQTISRRHLEHPQFADAVLIFAAGSLGAGEISIAQQAFAIGIGSGGYDNEPFRLGWQVAQAIKLYRERGPLPEVIETLRQASARLKRHGVGGGLATSSPAWLKALIAALLSVINSIPDLDDWYRALLEQQGQDAHSRLRNALQESNRDNPQRTAAVLEEELRLTAGLLEAIRSLPITDVSAQPGRQGSIRLRLLRALLRTDTGALEFDDVVEEALGQPKSSLAFLRRLPPRAHEAFQAAETDANRRQALAEAWGVASLLEILASLVQRTPDALKALSGRSESDLLVAQFLGLSKEDAVKLRLQLAHPKNRFIEAEMVDSLERILAGALGADRLIALLATLDSATLVAAGRGAGDALAGRLLGLQEEDAGELHRRLGRLRGRFADVPELTRLEQVLAEVLGLPDNVQLVERLVLSQPGSATDLNTARYFGRLAQMYTDKLGVTANEGEKPGVQILPAVTASEPAVPTSIGNVAGQAEVTSDAEGAPTAPAVSGNGLDSDDPLTHI